MVPADTISIDEDARLIILKNINMCETKGKFLDTQIVDQLLSIFNSKACFVFPTYSTVDGGMSPYYGKYIGKNILNDEVELIFLPLCDGCHFTGYIIDLKKKNIYIDYMYQPKYGKRSIDIKLKDMYFGSDVDVIYSASYGQRVQGDSHSCGAWLIAGFVGYVLGFVKNAKVLNREKVFNLMMILIENLDMSEKREKAMGIRLCPQRNEK